MSGPRRILTIFGTRPEAIKLFPLVHALRGDTRFDSRVCVSAQHRGMLDQVLAISGIAPDLMQPDQTLDSLTANGSGSRTGWTILSSKPVAARSMPRRALRGSRPSTWHWAAGSGCSSSRRC